MDATTSFVSKATNGALSRVPALDSTNYRQWSFAMQFLLDGEDLWEIVNQDTATATATASDREHKLEIEPGHYHKPRPLLRPIEERPRRLHI